MQEGPTLKNLQFESKFRWMANNTRFDLVGTLHESPILVSVLQLSPP
jgi:hypothetical protein